VTESTLAERYEALRAAAAAVLDEAEADDTPAPARYTVALRAMHDALLDGTVPDQPGPEQSGAAQPGAERFQDPARHMMTSRDYSAGMRGAPRALAGQARDIRRWLEADAPVADGHSGPGSVRNKAVFTELRAMAAGALLLELAARLVPGPAFGAGTDGEDLAALAIELAGGLLDNTVVGLH
jgi:hypothetical protein